MIEVGRMLAHYKLVEKIGEGGMGVVWKALDTTLNREVAIKILPEAFAVDPDRRARFEREARLLATLNHPGIAGVYGLHASDGVHFIAMEYVPGEDLAERLRRGPLSVDDAIDVGRQVAEALETAHEQGVIHRDLKPANIKLTPEGKIKVLDLGLARALAIDAGADPGSVSLSPTVTSAGTVAGTLLGTAAYMSPEQVKGREVDRRADRHLGLRLRAVRDAHGPTRFRRRDDFRDARIGAEGRDRRRGFTVRNSQGAPAFNPSLPRP
jgi:serine/threonine-protein kinase